MDRKDVGETPDKQAVEQKPTKRPDKIVTRKFDEWVRAGDLHVRIKWGESNTHVRGVVGDNGRRDLLILFVEAKNTHAGKLIEWPGWRNKGEVEDEYGNKFGPAEGWHVWYPWPGGVVNDFPARIPPTRGEPISAVLYFERVPVTSRTITVTLPFDDMLVKFTGKHN